jgi:uncharacterized OB-fold protein
MVEEVSQSVGRREPVAQVAGELDLSFDYAYGNEYRRFYEEMRDNKRIMGVKCSKCGAVLLPPRTYCGFCFEPADQWVELADEGTVITYTVVHQSSASGEEKPPFIYSFIRLDGADVHIPHLLGEIDPDDVEVGMRVQAVWSENREGALSDIKYFRPLR